MLLDLHDPVVGDLTVAANPIKLGDNPHVPARTAPQLGADQEIVDSLAAEVVDGGDVTT